MLLVALLQQDEGVELVELGQGGLDMARDLLLHLLDDVGGVQGEEHHSHHVLVHHGWAEDGDDDKQEEAELTEVGVDVLLVVVLLPDEVGIVLDSIQVAEDEEKDETEDEEEELVEEVGYLVLVSSVKVSFSSSAA